MKKASIVTIIIVDDDDGQVALIEKNLKRAKLNNPIIRFADGQQLLDFIDKGEKPEHITILLDLNMPNIDGYQVLERLKSNPDTAHIPIVVLTTTDDDREIDRCYRLGCNCYLTKPVNYDDFVEMIQQLGMFLSIVKIPD